MINLNEKIISALLGRLPELKTIIDYDEPLPYLYLFNLNYYEVPIKGTFRYKGFFTLIYKTKSPNISYNTSYIYNVKQELQQFKNDTLDQMMSVMTLDSENVDEVAADNGIIYNYMLRYTFEIIE
jgi:hypothetical protein